MPVIVSETRMKLFSVLLFSLSAAFPQSKSESEQIKVWGMISFSNSDCPNLSDPQYDLEKANQIVKSTDPKFTSKSIRSMAWHYPISGIQLEFYTGSTKYATIKGPKETRFLEMLCGFEPSNNEQAIEVEISEKVLKELNGRIFQSSDSFIKVVEQ